MPAAARGLVGAVPLTRVVAWVARPELAPAGVFDDTTAATAGRAAPAHLASVPNAAAAERRAAGRDALLLRTFVEAVAELDGRFGPDLARWRYGQARYKHAALRHPLGALVDSATRAAWDVGPAPRGGSGHTLNATGGTDQQTHGASLRLVADLADWDASLGTNVPGQSGDPRSPHYRDLFQPWAEGRYFRVPYTPRAVERATRAHEVLAP